MPGLKPRATTLLDLADAACFYVTPRPIQPDAKAMKLLKLESLERLQALIPALEGLTTWDEASIEALIRSEAERSGLKLGKIAQPLRAALTGSTASPGLFEVMVVLGRDETVARLSDAAARRDVDSDLDAASHLED